MLRLGLPAALTESHPAAPGVTPPAYVPTAKIASFRCTSCSSRNKDISYTQSPCCEFCGAAHVRK
jgi:hypothetical protein